MTIHIFNPEHDIALAANLSQFTAPHAGRQLRHDLGFLPALWAKEGDVVLVDDVELAETAFKRFIQSVKRRLTIVSDVETSSFKRGNSLFLPWKQVASNADNTSVQPWGWNKALHAALKRHGVGEWLLPTHDQLDAIRQLSHRRTSARLLSLLRQSGTVGESFECRSADEVESLLNRYQRLVLKAPWSSSGRGLRFLDAERAPLSMHAGWLRNIIDRQGSVMVEPYYNKVKDFGMEFTCLTDGSIRYEGLSLFHTVNGAYTGNIIATESAKREMLSHYLSMDLVDGIRETVCHELPAILQGRYHGPFGIDMMVCATSNDKAATTADKCFNLHPCVEINLRRTMGHVALSLTPNDDDVSCVMRIVYDGSSYSLKLERLHSSL